MGVEGRLHEFWGYEGAGVGRARGRKRERAEIGGRDGDRRRRWGGTWGRENVHMSVYLCETDSERECVLGVLKLSCRVVCRLRAASGLYPKRLSKHSRISGR